MTKLYADEFLMILNLLNNAVSKIGCQKRLEAMALP
jgi:hypothetical protein